MRAADQAFRSGIAVAGGRTPVPSRRRPTACRRRAAFLARAHLLAIGHRRYARLLGDALSPGRRVSLWLKAVLYAVVGRAYLTVAGRAPCLMSCVTFALTLLNPHADDFVKVPVSFWLVRRRALEEICILDRRTSEPRRPRRRSHRWHAVGGVRPEVVCPAAAVAAACVVVDRDRALEAHQRVRSTALSCTGPPKTIADRRFLYLFSYKACVGAFAERKEIIEQFHHKIVNLSHYFIRHVRKGRQHRRRSTT